MKQYRVTYWVKKGHKRRCEIAESQTAEAENAKAACEKVRDYCLNQLLYNAFRPHATLIKAQKAGDKL